MRPAAGSRRDRPVSWLLQEGIDGPEGARALTFVSSTKDDDVVPYSKLAVDIRRFAASYRRHGVDVGDRVVLMIPDSRSFVTAFFAAMHLGAVPVPVYPPMRIDSLGDYLNQTRYIVESSGATLIVTSNEVRRAIGSLVRDGRRLVTSEALWRERDEARLCERAMDDLALIQYTSGSTARPKGVKITYGNLEANVRCIADGLEIDPREDVGVSWLPLYHDMGLIGCVITSSVMRMPLVLIPPLDFLKRPSLWLRCISEHRGSLSFGPNFAYGLSTRRVRERELEGLDLSRWRVAGCGAEPIQRATLDGFAERFASVGFDARAFLPCYGLAESTLAVSFVPLESGVRSLHISREALLREGRAVVVEADAGDAEEVIPCGSCFEGHALGILGPGGLVEEGQVGEVVVRGPSVTSGYYEAPDANDALFYQGWLRTGDLGFMLDGQLVICGRKKDLIIVNGRNYYASDVEGATGGVAGVRRGQVVAFGVQRHGKENIVVCVETTTDADPDAVEADVRDAVMGRFGLNVADVAILPRGAIPKTSSGKVRRHKARALYMDRQLNGQRDDRLTTAKHLAMSQVGLFQHQMAGLFDRLRPGNNRKGS